LSPLTGVASASAEITLRFQGLQRWLHDGAAIGVDLSDRAAIGLGGEHGSV